MPTHGLGYLIPLGLVSIGGPLIDAGFAVKVDRSRSLRMAFSRLIQEIADFKADYILLGHSGSTAAHKTAIKTIKAIHQELPHLRVVYGGVYPSYAHRAVMAECEEIDAIVRGEGRRRSWPAPYLGTDEDLSYVDGVTWRKGRRSSSIARGHRSKTWMNIVLAGNSSIRQRYSMFGFKNAARFQFSRGCTLTCTYCGQWMFWKKWRHRSPENVVEQLKILDKSIWRENRLVCG